MVSFLTGVFLSQVLSTPISVPHPPSLLSREERGLALPPKSETWEPREGEELTISPDCEFWLNGKKCEYKDIPPGCDICEVGVSEGKVVVLKFQSVPKRMPTLAPAPRVK